MTKSPSPVAHHPQQPYLGSMSPDGLSKNAHKTVKIRATPGPPSYCLLLLLLTVYLPKLGVHPRPYPGSAKQIAKQLGDLAYVN